MAAKRRSIDFFRILLAPFSPPRLPSRRAGPRPVWRCPSAGARRHGQTPRCGRTRRRRTRTAFPDCTTDRTGYAVRPAIIRPGRRPLTERRFWSRDGGALVDFEDLVHLRALWPCPTPACRAAASWPDCSKTLAWSKASPRPPSSTTNPKPFSGLNHFTVARVGGPDGGWRRGAGEANPRGRRAKTSSSRPRRRGLRKLLSLIKSGNPDLGKACSILPTIGLVERASGLTGFALPFGPLLLLVVIDGPARSL